MYGHQTPLLALVWTGFFLRKIAGGGGLVICEVGGAYIRNTQRGKNLHKEQKTLVGVWQERLVQWGLEYILQILFLISPLEEYSSYTSSCTAATGIADCTTAKPELVQE